jgi:hypothetical protein
MDTATQTVGESAALLASPAGWRRMTVAVSDLRPGDVVVGGAQVEIERVETEGGAR